MRMAHCDMNVGRFARSRVFEAQQCAVHHYLEFPMTTISLSRETVRNPSFPAAGLMGQIKGFVARHAAERQLRQLDDRLLADIGLKRADIGKAVWVS